MSIRIGTMRRRRRGGSLVWLILSATFLITSVMIGLLVILPGLQARYSGVETVGVVKSIDVCTDSGDSGGDVALRGAPLIAYDDNVQPTIDFTDQQGQTHEVQSVICGTFDVGEHIAIWYVPAHPDTFALDQDTGGLIGFGIGLAAVAVVCLLALVLLGGRYLLLIIMASRNLKQQPAYVGGYQPMPAQPQMGGYGQMGGAASMGGYPSAGGYGYPASGGYPGGVGMSHRVGELVTVADHWAITVTNVSPSQGNAVATASPGRFYLLGQVALRNISNEMLNFSQATFRLTDASGVEYQRAQTMEGTAPGFIQPGMQVAAAVAFDVPGTLRQFRLSLYLPMSSQAQATWDITV